MEIAVFSTKPYSRTYFQDASAGKHRFRFFEARLHLETTALAEGYPAVCVFVNDVVDRDVLERLDRGGTRIVALRCSGFNNVDLATADRLGITVVRVPAYSPYSVAEHAVALILALNRRIHRAFNRVREGNFSLEGMVGFDMRGRTAGIVGTGRIGQVAARILAGFDCRIVAYDPIPNEELVRAGVEYLPLEGLLQQADIVSLHCPLIPATQHLIDAQAVAQMKRGMMLVNTSRGALVDTQAVIDGLKSGRIGYLGLDVYEEEADLFFENLSDQVLQDDIFARLLTFPNVIITGHQAFFTDDALRSIAVTTLQNITDEEAGKVCPNRVTAREVAR